MMELFDRKFVHFMWDNELIGKKCFFADGIDDLRGIVEKGGEYDMRIVLSSGIESAPFLAAHGVYAWKFAYYDPNYEVKKAFSEGKTVQVKRIDSFADWVDCDEPIWSKEYCYRVKPKEEEKRYRPYKDSAEMIVDFIDRFNVNCPTYAVPLIWVRLKVDRRKRLIVAFGDNFVEIGNKTKAVALQHLFEQYEFLDGSPVGMEN